ncbi:MAG: hypothetical protein IPO73_07475 [Gemmatimonadetes bacterium]|nr:hypothetical protein [Gemmatimonadota bacterium]
MRRSPGRAILPALLVVALACAGGADHDEAEAQDQEAEPAALVPVGEGAGLALDSALRERMGIRLTTLARAAVRPEREVPAFVVDDPGATTTVRAAVGGRLLPAGDGPWPRIGELLSADELIAVVGDARPIAVPRGGTVTRLLAQPGELVQAGQPLLELVDYGHPLAQVAWAGEGAPPARLAFALTPGSTRIAGGLAGAAPTADPLTRLPAYHYRLAGAAGLRPGVLLTGYLPDPDAPSGAVLVPDDAVVQWDALAWVYVERAPGRFLRVHVATTHPVPGGWLVTEGAVPGDRVVSRGAGQLLSEEFRARITVGEEVGE